MKQLLGIFDFDGTLTRKDTFIQFGIFAVGRGRFIRCLLLSLPWLAGWKLKLNSSSKAKEKLFSCLFKGMTLSKFNQLGKEFATEIDKITNPATIARLQELQGNDAETIIASASLENWIIPWAQRNNITAVIATTPEVSDGILTGRFASANCIGKEKAAKIRQYIAQKFPSDPIEIFAFGNMPDDAEMLALADHPTVIK